MHKIISDALVKIILSKQKGTDRNVVQERKALMFKKFEHINLIKRSSFWARFVGYEAQKATQEARKNGMEHRPNHWESYQSLCEGFFKDDKGTFKLGLGGAAFEHAREHAMWFLNGNKVTYESIEFMLKSGDKRKDKKPFLWITPNAENVVEIDGHVVKPSVATV